MSIAAPAKDVPGALWSMPTAISAPLRAETHRPKAPSECKDFARDSLAEDDRQRVGVETLPAHSEPR